MQKSNKKKIEEFIRVDHAGERGAIKIYEGQLLALNTIVKNDELNILEVVEIELNQGVEVTYNIEKTRNGNYFANKVLVSDESEIPFT